jgi:hypothetical protein
MLDRTSIVLIKRDQLAVEHSAHAEHVKRRRQLEQRHGQCWCHPTTTPGTPVGPGFDENREGGFARERRA